MLMLTRNRLVVTAKNRLTRRLRLYLNSTCSTCPT